MLQTLERISRPTGALAVVKQSKTTRQTPPPRGMLLNPMYVQERTQTVPSAAAADHIGALQRGFMSTRTVMAIEAAMEVPMMLAAETRELRHAKAGVQPPDESLPPRPVSVMLLCHGNNPAFCSTGRTCLDALGHLATVSLGTETTGPPAASEIRMSVLAGVDARWYVSQVHGEVLENASGVMTECGVEVCVRWANAEGGMRSEFQALRTGLSLDQSLEEMQNAFLSMKVAYGAPFPATICAVQNNVLVDAWARSVHAASKAFFETMESEPGVFKSKALRDNEADIEMQSTGVFVRICPRNRHSPTPQEPNRWEPVPVGEAVLRQDAFHAILIGNTARAAEIAQYCKTNQLEGLPLGDDEAQPFCLHTCAVQANAFYLRQQVSLYATHLRSGGRLPGMPICSPGSWVWRLQAAIVPVEQVLQSFYVVPCSRESVMPGDHKLEMAFNDFFSRAFRLFADTFGMYKTAPADEFERMPLSLPARSTGGDPAIRGAEEYALTAFSLDASSRRLAVGDAFSMLTERRAPPELTDFMLQASLRMGIGTSVVDAVGTAAQALRGIANAGMEAQKREALRCTRIANAALDVSAKRPRTLAPSVPIEPARVKALLTAANLVRGEEALMPKAPGADWTAYDSVVRAVASCILKEPLEETAHEQACRAAARVRAQSELTSLCTLITVLRGCCGAIASTLFVISQTGPDEVSFNRAGYGGLLEAASKGSIIDAPVRSVLLLKTTNRGLRVTATKAG